MKILIVDDSETALALLETFLRNSGYQDVALAQSAEEAMKILTACNKKAYAPPIDLILMDIVMPGMTGIEAVRLIKADHELADIPIIMVTVKDGEQCLEMAFNAGAVDYINKPVSQVELRARVRSALRLKEEIDRRKAREHDLEKLTHILEIQSKLDGLTGVANRRCFDETFEKEWNRSRRKGPMLALLLIDIDFFKAYNDTYGHLQGDQCLKQVAATLQSSLKRSGDFAARYGGEEFVVVLPDTQEDGACQMADDIRRSVENLQIEHSQSGIHDYLTVSVGVAACMPENNIIPDMLLSAADRALYLAKANGRNQVRIAAVE